MEEEMTIQGTETPTTGAGDTEYTLTVADTDGEQTKTGDETFTEDEFQVEGETDLMGEYGENEYLECEIMEHLELQQKRLEMGEELMGEELEEEYSKAEETEEEEYIPAEEENPEEEIVEEPPPDPAAPYDFSDSKELLREPFELRQEQIMEVEMLWELYQNYTPAYTNLDNYITEKELVYMLKALLLMTYTPEQLIELIEFCVRPPHPEGHITYDQFLKMVTLRQRDFVVEEELRAALHVFDPENTGLVDREHLREVLSKQGHKLHPKQLEHLIKEVDISNDGTIGIEDMIGTMCIDLNREDIQMLKDALNTNGGGNPADEEEEI